MVEIKFSDITARSKMFANILSIRILEWLVILWLVVELKTPTIIYDFL